MNDLIRPTLYDAHHDIRPVRAGRPRRRRGMVADVVGGICETGDYLALDRPLPPLAAGDLVAIMTAGAYGAVQASHLQHPAARCPRSWSRAANGRSSARARPMTS